MPDEYIALEDHDGRKVTATPEGALEARDGGLGPRRWFKVVGRRDTPPPSWTVPTPTPDPPADTVIQGQLRISPDGKSYQDDTGDIVPVGCHTGDVMAMYVNGNTAKAQAIIDTIAEAGYGIITLWLTLNWRNNTNDWWGDTWIYPTTPAEWQRCAECVAYCHSKGLKVDLDNGDLTMGDAAERRLFEGIRDKLIPAVGPEAFSMIFACNEVKWAGNPDDLDPVHLEGLIDIVRQRYPQILYGLSAVEATEDRDVIRAYTMDSAQFYTFHAWRQGTYGSKSRHARVFGMNVHGEQMVRWLGHNGEGPGPNLPPYVPMGPGRWVSSQANHAQLQQKRHAMAIYALASVLGGQLYIYFCSAGVKSDADFTQFRGFTEVPKALALLPKDIYRYSRIHGGPAHAGTRIFHAPDGWRIEQGILGNRFVALSFPDGPDVPAQDISVERSCTFDVYDPGTAAKVDSETRPAGSTYRMEPRWLVLGRLT